MKKFASLIVVLILSGIIFFSCSKDEPDQVYKDYTVVYSLKNNLGHAKRFTITYKQPDFANNTTEQYEAILDTFNVRFTAKSLDFLYLACQTRNDTADYSISIYVNDELMVKDSTSCEWQCDSTFVEIDYPLP
jgi:hypothetical protein